MENTVDAVLTHGDANPQDLVQRLEQSKSGASMAELDEQLARQLSAQEQQHNPLQQTRQQQQQPSAPAPASTSQGLSNTNTITSASSSSPAPTAKWKKGRGTATNLPQDFLRIPGAPNAGALANDEALARMLQDKLFAEEIKNNPEFAHLARGRSNFNPGFPGGRRQGGAVPREGPDVVKALQGMGEQAKKRFQDLASKFKNKLNENKNQSQTQNGFGSGGGAAERRGLLDIHDDDDEEQEISFVGGGSGTARPDYEMRSMAAGGAKKHD